MKNFKRWKKRRFLGIGVLALALLLCFVLNRSGEIEAADAQYMIKFTGEEKGSNAEYTLRNREITATYVDSNNAAPVGAAVKWSISGDDKILKIKGGVGDANVSLEAVGAGTAELTAAITVGTSTIYASRKITVGYAIDEDVTDGFVLIPKLSKDAVMVLSVGDTSYHNANNPKPGNTLDFVFPCANITWRSENSRVVSMSENTYESTNTTGYFRAVGTGVTKITASYKTDDGKTQIVDVTVYVGPAPQVNGNNIMDSVSIKNGTSIYTGAILGTGKTIKDHLEWVVKDEQNNILSTSSDTNEKVLISSAYSPNLTVDAKAGTYYITFYTAGVYSAGIEQIEVLSKTFRIYVLAECSDVVKSLQVNDIFNIAEAYNMKAEDFKSCFDVQVTTGNGVVDTIQIDEGIVRAKGEGKAILSLRVNDKNLLSKLTGKDVNALPPQYTIELNVYKGFVLDRTAVTISEGASLALVANYNEGIAENIVWMSADENFVTVTQKGVITGIKDSSGNEILVTASMQLSDGRTLKATCKVTVTKTAEKIILSETDLRMQVGQTATVKATFEPTSITAIPGLKWLVTNEEVVTIGEGSGNSVVVTAKGAGTTILTAVNQDNFVAAYCKITVLAPITKISLVEGDQMTLKLAQESVKFHAEYNDDATDVNLIWSSSNETAAKIDQTGFVTLKGAGTTIITVMPEWNPKNVMAQCRLTVIESATSFGIKESSVTVEAGATVTLTPEIKSENASTTIKWDSMDKSIATVSEKGVVRGVKAGQTYIVASSLEGYVDTCLVTVTQKASGVTLDVYTLNLAVGESYTVTAKPNPAGATETTFKWSSKDKNIATVDNNGKITGVEAGSTIVTVKPSTGNSEIIYVTVYSKVTGMKLNYENATIIKGDTLKLKPIFTPTNVTNKKVTYKSSDEKVATVTDAGTVKGIKGGTAIISATSEDGGYTAICLITVQERITSVKLNKTSYVLGIGRTYRLKATVTSNSASNPSVKWTTSNGNVVTVSQNGNLKGKKVGTATITAKVTDGTGKKATCKVRVVKSATSVSLNKKVLNVVLGQTEKLKATVKPTTATIKTVSWASSNPEIAEVEGGTVVGLSVGSTRVTATVKDNSGKKAICYVNVIEEVPTTSIVLSAQNFTLTKGQQQKIGYSIVPANHTDKVFFASDNPAIASVNGSGTVYARKAGVANITITTTSGKQVTVKVTVIGLNKTKVTLEQYDTETLYVDGVTSGVTWFSSNPSVATVDQGRITAKKEGTCTVYAKVNGVNLACTVVVKKIS